MAILFEFTDAGDFGSLFDNIVRVTGGTSGTPATFADFVTFDRAGTGTTILDAGTPANNLALDTPVRPVEDLAILVKCIVANKTAQPDFIFITGTDWRGAAQTESINVTAGNGSYTSTKYWSAITTLDCSDNPAGGGTVWADGDLSVTQDIWGVIWDYGGGQYRIDADVDFGDGGTSTYFESEKEQIYWNDGVSFTIKSAAELRVGSKIVGDWGYDGSYWSYSPGANLVIIANGQTTAKFYGYGSTFQSRENNRVQFADGDIVINKCIISFSIHTLGDANFELKPGINTVSIKDCYFPRIKSVYFAIVPDTFSGNHVHWALYGALMENDAGGTVSIPSLTATSIVTNDIRNTRGSSIFNVVDPNFTVSSVRIDNATGVIAVQHTCNIHVADKDGIDLASALIDCEYAHLVEGSDAKTYKCIADHTAVDATHKPITGTDWATYWELYDAGGGLGGDWNTGFDYKSGTAEFAQQTVDAAGDMTEQNIQYKKWVGTSEVLEVRIHKFTISKAGYETLVKDDIMADSPIGKGLPWHLEMLPALSEDDVESGVSFGENKTGNFTEPGVGNVEAGVQYGANGVEFEGNFEVPAEALVKLGISYGANGIEFTGTLIQPMLPLVVVTELDGILDLALTVEDVIDVSVEVI